MEEYAQEGAPHAPVVSMDDIMARWARSEALEAEFHPINKVNLLSALAAAGIATVIIRFDGCGDSGQIEEVDAVDAEGIGLAIPSTPIELFELPWGEEVAAATTMPLDQALETHAYRLLSSTHPGWENNDGAFGEFTFDVAADVIRLEHSDRYTATEEYNHDF